MQAMKDFAIWFLEQIPAFLMREPICYIVAFFFIGLAIHYIKTSLLKIKTP